MSQLKQNYYRHHIFVCTNVKEQGKCCGGTSLAADIVSALKKHYKAQGLNGEGGIRVSKSGCLGRCHEGPVAVVYPKGQWIHLKQQDEVSELFGLV